MMNIPSKSPKFEDAMQQNFKEIIPRITENRNKGSNGKIGVIGGSERYTGAPFFAAMAALRSGSDLVYILTTAEAVVPIKCYSPELIVMPYLPSEMRDGEGGDALWESYAHKSDAILKRLTAVVVGPGLGVEEAATSTAAKLLSKCISYEIPIILDADGIRVLEHHTSLMAALLKYRWCVFTPNIREAPILQRSIFAALQGDCGGDVNNTSLLGLSVYMDGPLIVEKGYRDVLSYKGESVYVDGCGEVKRIGGMGDILCGLLATFISWGKEAADNSEDDASYVTDDMQHPLLIPTYIACMATKRAALTAFKANGISLITSDILQCLPKIINELSTTTSA